MTQISKTALEKLKLQRDKLNARIQAAEARGKQSERKKDTRRKILVGSYFLDQATQQGQMEGSSQQGYRTSEVKVFIPSISHSDG